jgi:hypothetical protein
VDVSFKYGAEALAMAGIAYGLIKWVGRNVRSLISDSGVENARVQAIAAAKTPVAAADSLVRHGVVNAEDFAAMSPREREFLVATAGPQIEAARARGQSIRPTPTSTPALRSPTPAAARPAMPTPPRLHLITPSRPALGLAVFCPGCGIALDRDALQKYGVTSCARCKREVSAHIQRGRLTVIVEETEEEGEHRRRVEGGQ